MGSRPLSSLEQAFGETVRNLRTERGVSQEELADASGIHRTFLSQVERGLKSPSLRTMSGLAEALEIPLHQLVRRVCQQRDRRVRKRRKNAGAR